MSATQYAGRMRSPRRRRNPAGDGRGLVVEQGSYERGAEQEAGEHEEDHDAHVAAGHEASRPAVEGEAREIAGVVDDDEQHGKGAEPVEAGEPGRARRRVHPVVRVGSTGRTSAGARDHRSPRGTPPRR